MPSQNCESCVFDLKLSVAIIQKGFGKSFGEGVSALKTESKNLVTYVKERLVPEGARFDKVVAYEFKDGEVFWQGDSKPVAYHLEKNTKLLVIQGASDELVRQGKRDEDVWQVLKPMLSHLKPGDAIQYLSQKDPDPSKGVALQQIVNDNGVLIHQSHLLPFNDMDQINKFMQFAGEEKQDLSLDEEVSGWIVTGKRIDFDQGLPKLILESMMVLPGNVSWQEAIMPAWPQLFWPATLDIGVDAQHLTETQTNDMVASVEPSSFWWQLLASQTELGSTELTREGSVIGEPKTRIIEGPQVFSETFESKGVDIVFVAAEQSEEWQELKKPQKKETIVAVQPVEEPKKREAIILAVSKPKSEIKKEKVIPKVRGEKAATTIYQAQPPKVKQEITSEVKKSKIEKKRDMLKSKKDKKIFILKRQEKKMVATTGKAVEKMTKNIEPEVPWWQISFEGIDANDVPEWRWQQAWWLDFNYLKELAWIVSIRNFAIVNISWVQNEPNLVTMPVVASDSRGSGLAQKAILVDANRGSKISDLV